MNYSLLNLGDSYTLGEGVTLTENFPYQTVQLLRKEGLTFTAPEILAKTGWTTDELQGAMSNYLFQPAYDFVTLLIGVNNQYRGRSPDNFLPEFESILKQAIGFVGGKINHTIVLSIPDWGVTPFAAGRDRKKISEEIENYNAVCKKIAHWLGVHYLDITPGTREAARDPLLIASDGLHPSAREYNRWAIKIADLITNQVKNIFKNSSH